MIRIEPWRVARLGLAAALIATASLTLSARSLGAVTIGVSLNQPSLGSAGSGGGATFVQTALPGGVNQSPIDGVAVRYRVQSNTWGSIRLRILRPAAGGAFDGVGTSATSTLSGAFDDLVHEFPTRLPIATGDRIGIDTTGNARIRNNLPMGSNYGYWFPFLTDSAPPSAPTSSAPAANTHAVLFNADVELDADKDLFGDETQDGCPSNASIQTACPVPSVAPVPAKKKCKRKKKRGTSATASRKKRCKGKRKKR